jgi:tetratricopeptide (TPR) repeat protein
LLVDAAREADEFGPALAKSVRQAKWAWKNGDLEGAIAAYHRAVGEAHQSGRGAFAVELALHMATLQTEARDFDGAVTTLTGLLDSYPDTPRAAEAHLLRAYALGKRYAQRPDEERKQAYRAALDEHRKKFADSPTWAEATWMLARLEEHEGRWSEAIALLESIPVASKRGEDAQVELALAYEQAIEDLRQRGEPPDEEVRKAIVALNAAVRTFPPEPELFSDSQAEVAWRLARLLLSQKPPDFVLADRLLDRVLRSAEHSTDGASAAKRQAGGTTREWFANASQLRIISLAGQGRLDEARDVVAQMDGSDPDHVLDVLTGLSAAADQVAIERRQSVGQLQWELSQHLEEQRESLSAEQKLKLDECLARAHAALGRYPEAAALYQKLLWQRPDDQRLLEALARLYESCGSTSCLRNALTQWQALEHRQRKGTQEWLESRYHMAWCSHQVGDDEAARKLIGVTRLLYPELGSPELKRQFAELAAELSSRGGD